MAASRRKGWDDLSATYRKRLIRGGINRKSYESGAALHKARGKGSAQKESQRDRFRRLVDKSGFDKGEVAEVVAAIGFQDAYNILDMRNNAFNASDAMGRHLARGAMRVLYAQFEGMVPKEWLQYGAKGK